MNNISPEIFEQIREAIKTPIGSFVFEYHSKDLMNQAHSGGIIFEIASGAHVFRLERNNDFLLNFYHSSPGTGTRIATIDLKSVPQCEQAFISFTWSPDEINLYFGPRIQEGELFSAKGEPCKFELCVGEDGSIYQIGDKNVNVMNVSFFQDGKQILSPTAINSWNDTKKALEILETGESKEGYVFESIVSNVTISILVTGFESYAKKRAIELEKEGIEPDTTAFFADSEKEKLELYQKEAKEENLTLLQYLAKKRIINFQSYKQCKRAFNKIYGIKFGSIGCESNTLSKLQEFIAFRHTIIHVSALTGMLNQSKVPPEEPIFSNKILSKEAIRIFDLFINKLHEATLSRKKLTSELKNFMKHEKKVWPEYFQKILDGDKTYELRLADWECNAGDILVLQEWNPQTKEFTGRTIEKTVTYVGKTKDMTFWPKEDVDKYGYQIIAFK